MNNSKTGSLFGTIGVVGGVIYGMRKDSGFAKTALFAALFGVSGLILGNALSKFYDY